MDSKIIFKRSDRGVRLNDEGHWVDQQALRVVPVNADNFPRRFTAWYLIERDMQTGRVHISGWKQARDQHGRRYEGFSDECEFERSLIRWSNRIYREHRKQRMERERYQERCRKV